MTQNAIAKTWNISRTGTGNKFNSWQPQGLNNKTINGSGFGAGPDVVVFDRFSGQNVGETIDTVADVGNWREGGNFAYNNRPPVVEFDGRKGISHNDPASGQGATRYGLGIENLNYVRFTEFMKIGVPNGRTFPGATALQTFPNVSSMKVNWHSGYGWNGSAGESDLVSLTHGGNGTFYTGGNNIAGTQINGFASAWEWNKWNSVITTYQPDSPDIQGPNGSSNMRLVNGNGTMASLSGPFACWESVGDALPTPLKFDRVAVLSWSGNGTHTDSQLVMTNYYLAVGDNSSKYLALTNNSDISAATNVDVIAANVWEDSQIQFTMSDEEDAINTHWFVMDDQTVMATGEI